MNHPLLAILLWSVGASSALHGVTTSLLKTGGLVADPAFENPSAIITDDRDSGIDAQGYSFESRNASATIHTDTTVDTGNGGGRRIIDSTNTLTSFQRERETTSGSGLQFNAEHQFHASLSMVTNLSTYGRFFFVVVGESTNSLNLDRRLQFVADQPIQIGLSLEGSGTNLGLNDILSTVLLLGATHGGPFLFGDILFRQNNSESIIDYSGSGAGADFRITGTNQNNRLNLTLLIEPDGSESAPNFELRWIANNDLGVTFPPVLRSSSNFGENDLNFSESVSIQSVPEARPTAIILASFAFISFRRHRNRTQTPVHRHPSQA